MHKLTFDVQCKILILKKKHSEPLVWILVKVRLGYTVYCRTLPSKETFMLSDIQYMVSRISIIMLSKNSDRISNLRSELQGVVESTAPTPLSRCVVLKGYELNRWPSMLLQAGWDYVVAHDQPGGCRAPHVLGLLLCYVLGRRVAYFISRYMANGSYVYLLLKCMGGRWWDYCTTTTSSGKLEITLDIGSVRITPLSAICQM